MRALIWLVWIAGAVQLALVAANVALPRQLRCREELSRLSAIIRWQPGLARE